MAERWVSNASPLIVLARSGHLKLLRALPVPVLVPAGVLGELDAGNARDGAADAVRALALVTVVEDLEVPTSIASWRLDTGESQVLARAVSIGAGVLLDDRAARRCAQTLGLAIVGSIGLIARAKRAGLVTAAGPVTSAVVEAGLHVDDEMVRAVLADLGEA